MLAPPPSKTPLTSIHQPAYGPPAPRSRGQLRNGVAGGYTKLYAMTAALCVALDLALPGEIGLVLASALYLVCAMWFGWHEYQVGQPQVNPIVTYQLWQAATLGIAPLYRVLRHGASDAPFGDYRLPLSQVAYGHAIMVVGACALYVGMKHFQPRPPIRQTSMARPPSVMALGFAVVAGGAISFFRDAVKGYAGSSVAQFSLLPMAVLCIIGLNPPKLIRRTKGAQLAILIVGSLFLFLVNARSDSKMDLMFSFIPLIWWVVRSKRAALLVPAGLGFSMLYVLAISPLVMSLRNKMGKDDQQLIRALAPSDDVQVFGILQNEFLNDPAAYAQAGLDTFMGRLMDPTAAGMVARLADERGFLKGQSFTYIPTMLVPRFLWRDKPIVDRGRQFTTALGWASDASTATTSTGETAAGELYWNFGWLGIVIGMYLLGAAVTGLWWRAAGTEPGRGVMEMTAYLGVTLSFIVGTGGTASSLALACLFAGIFWRVLIYVRNTAMRRKHAKSPARMRWQGAA